MDNQPISESTINLIIVPGHAVYGGNCAADAYDGTKWVGTYSGYRYNDEVMNYVRHVQRGINLADRDPRSLLVFSGGKTRKATETSEAQSYSILAKQLSWLGAPAVKDLIVFTVSRKTVPFHFNPLIPPPGTEPGEWLMKLVDVLKHAYFVGEGVEYLLRDAIDLVYEDCGFHDGSRSSSPTFLRVRNYVMKKRVHGRMQLWKASALRVLESLCFRHGLGSVLNRDQEWDHEGLLKSATVLELDALSDVDKAFLTEAMILWLYEFRKNEGKREKFKHALIIEEAHHILSSKKESAEGVETIMESSLRQIREFGEAVIVIDQEPAKLSDSICQHRRKRGPISPV